MSRRKKKKQNASKWLMLLLVLITIAAVCVTIWALFFRNEKKDLTPDYAPVQTEENAQELPDDSDEKLEVPEGGGSVSLSYSNAVTIKLSEENAELYFANPGKSNQDIVLQIVVQDTIIVQSGTLKPGNQVTSLKLLEGAAKQLSVGGYEGKFVLLYYSPENGEKAVVNTEIPVSITVVE